MTYPVEIGQLVRGVGGPSANWSEGLAHHRRGRSGVIPWSYTRSGVAGPVVLVIHHPSSLVPIEIIAQKNELLVVHRSSPEAWGASPPSMRIAHDFPHFSGWQSIALHAV